MLNAIRNFLGRWYRPKQVWVVMLGNDGWWRVTREDRRIGFDIKTLDGRIFTLYEMRGPGGPDPLYIYTETGSIWRGAGFDIATLNKPMHQEILKREGR